MKRNYDIYFLRAELKRKISNLNNGQLIQIHNIKDFKYYSEIFIITKSLKTRLLDFKYYVYSLKKQRIYYLYGISEERYFCLKPKKKKFVNMFGINEYDIKVLS